MSRLMILAFAASTLALTVSPLAMWRTVKPPDPFEEERARMTAIAGPLLARLESYRIAHGSFPRCLGDLPVALPTGATIIDYCRMPSGQDFVLTLGDNVTKYRWGAGDREGARYEPFIFQDVVPIEWLLEPALK